MARKATSDQNDMNISRYSSDDPYYSNAEELVSDYNQNQSYSPKKSKSNQKPNKKSQIEKKQSNLSRADQEAKYNAKILNLQKKGITITDEQVARLHSFSKRKNSSKLETLKLYYSFIYSNYKNKEEEEEEVEEEEKYQSIEERGNEEQMSDNIEEEEEYVEVNNGEEEEEEEEKIEKEFSKKAPTQNDTLTKNRKSTKSSLPSSRTLSSTKKNAPTKKSSIENQSDEDPYLIQRGKKININKLPVYDEVPDSDIVKVEEINNDDVPSDKKLIKITKTVYVNDYDKQDDQLNNTKLSRNESDDLNHLSDPKSKHDRYHHKIQKNSIKSDNYQRLHSSQQFVEPEQNVYPISKSKIPNKQSMKTKDYQKIVVNDYNDDNSDQYNSNDAKQPNLSKSQYSSRSLAIKNPYFVFNDINTKQNKQKRKSNQAKRNQQIASKLNSSLDEKSPIKKQNNRPKDMPQTEPSTNQDEQEVIYIEDQANQNVYRITKSKSTDFSFNRDFLNSLRNASSIRAKPALIERDINNNAFIQRENIQNSNFSRSQIISRNLSNSNLDIKDMLNNPELLDNELGHRSYRSPNTVNQISRNTEVKRTKIPAWQKQMFTIDPIPEISDSYEAGKDEDISREEEEVEEENDFNEMFKYYNKGKGNTNKKVPKLIPVKWDLEMEDFVIPETDTKKIIKNLYAEYNIDELLQKAFRLKK